MVMKLFERARHHKEELYASLHLGFVALVVCLQFEYHDRRDRERHKDDMRKREERHKDDMRKREERHDDDMRKREIASEYTHIADLETLALKACKDATGSSCTSAHDLLRFAEIYARSRAIEQHTLPRPWFRFGFGRSTLSSVQLEHVERYRKACRVYFTNIYDFENKATQPFHPGKDEFESYLTFHWTVTMAKAICAEKRKLLAPFNGLGHPKNYDYDRVLDAVKDRDEETYRRVADIQSDVRNKLLDIRSNLFQGAQDDS